MGLFDFIMNDEYEKYLDIQRNFDSRIAPKDLIKELEHKFIMKKFVKIINKTSSSSYKIVRRLHICNLLLMYSDKFYTALVEEIKIPMSEDKWLNEQFIKPYIRFIYKCSTEYEMFMQCKKSCINEQKIFDQLFFLINLLKILFKSTSKISLIGKFYKSKCSPVFQGVIEMIAIQGKQLYFAFKNILITILQNTQKYLKTSEHQVIMKNILIKDLAEINEDMKMLLLSKEFYPYGKSIGIKLFRTDQATIQLQNTMRGIVTDHCQTRRKQYRQEMEGMLFDKDQGFNVKYFQETLTGISGSTSNGLTFGLGKNKPKPQSQEVVESQDEDPQQQNSKKLAETNESNLNKLDNI